jgi:hypothetical protein
MLSIFIGFDSCVIEQTDYNTGFETENFLAQSATVDFEKNTLTAFGVIPKNRYNKM